MKTLIIIVTGLFLFCTSCDNDMITSQTEADANKEIAAETSTNPLNISNGKQVTKPLFFKNVTGTIEFMPNPELCTSYGGFMQALAPGSGQGGQRGQRGQNSPLFSLPSDSSAWISYRLREHF